MFTVVWKFVHMRTNHLRWQCTMAYLPPIHNPITHRNPYMCDPELVHAVKFLLRQKGVPMVLKGNQAKVVVVGKEGGTGKGKLVGGSLSGTR